MNKYFYQSIPYYDHKVYACKGMVGDALHETFYLDFFSKFESAGDREPKQYKVLILEGYHGNRVNEDLTPFPSPEGKGEIKRLENKIVELRASGNMDEEIQKLEDYLENWKKSQYGEKAIREGKGYK